MLIDDNDDISELVSLCLDIVDKGLAGLRSLNESNFDVVSLDLAMPAFRGFNTFKTLMAEDLSNYKNIVIFTAFSITGSEVQEMVFNGAKGELKTYLDRRLDRNS